MNIDNIIKRIRAGEFKNPIQYSAATREEYRAADQQNNLKLRKALAEEAGWVFDSTLEKLLWEKAWQSGHSSGYEQVAWDYDNFNDVAEAARDAFM